MVPESRKYARVRVGSGCNNRTFWLKCPEGNPNFLTTSVRVRPGPRSPFWAQPGKGAHTADHGLAICCTYFGG